MVKKATGVAFLLLFVIFSATASAANLTKIELLGKNLFFDKTLSSPTGQACATCHSPQAGWTGPDSKINAHGAVYPGAVPHRFGNRKPPTAAYATTSPIFYFDEGGEDIFFGGNFWDGRATGEKLGNPAADQAQGPFVNSVEQNNPDKETVVYKVCSSKTAQLFKKVAAEFYEKWDLDICSPQNTDMAYDMIGIAIGVYEDSSEVNQFSSKFDAYLRACKRMGRDYLDLSPRRDPTRILNKLEWEGLRLFANTENNNDGILKEGEGAACAACHVLDYTATETALSQAKKRKVDSTFPTEEVTLPPQLTDYSFDNLGVPINPENTFYAMDQVLVNGDPINPVGADWIDPGLGGFLAKSGDGDWEDMADDNYGKHKVPTLRNLDKRPSKKFVKSYTHNGYFKTLKGIVHFYNTRDEKAECPDPYTEAEAIKNDCWPAPEGSDVFPMDTVNGDELGNLGLNKYQEYAIVAFMKTLTDRNFEK